MSTQDSPLLGPAAIRLTRARAALATVLSLVVALGVPLATTQADAAVATATISGALTPAPGGSLTNATVSANNVDGGNPVWGTITGTSWTVGDLPPGAYRVAVHPGDSVSGFYQSGPLTLVANDRRTLDITLPAASSVSVLVNAPPGYTGPGAISIVLSSENGAFTMVRQTSYGSAATFTGVGTGRYTVGVNDENDRAPRLYLGDVYQYTKAELRAGPPPGGSATWTLTFPRLVFGDVPLASQFGTEIAWFANRGITTGYADGTFRPLDDVSREATAAFLYRFVHSPAVALPARSPFRDVTPASPFYSAIIWGWQQGIIKGWSDGTFRPKDPVHRDAAAVFLWRLSRLSPYSLLETAPATSPFRDVATSNPFYPQIGSLWKSGIITGWPDGTYRPLQNVQRDAMAAFFYRYVGATGNGCAPGCH